MAWKSYRMYKGQMVHDGFGSGYHKGKPEDFSPTNVVIKARTHDEATKRMDKFIKDGQITGSFFMKEEK